MAVPASGIPNPGGSCFGDNTVSGGFCATGGGGGGRGCDAACSAAV